MAPGAFTPVVCTDLLPHRTRDDPFSLALGGVPEVPRDNADGPTKLVQHRNGRQLIVAAVRGREPQKSAKRLILRRALQASDTGERVEVCQLGPGATPRAPKLAIDEGVEFSRRDARL